METDQRLRSFTEPDVIEFCGMKFRKPTAGTYGLLLDMKNELIPECRPLKKTPDGRDVSVEINGELVPVREDPKNISFCVGAFLWIHATEPNICRRAIWSGDTETIQAGAFSILDSFPGDKIGEAFSIVERLITEFVRANDFDVAHEKNAKSETPRGPDPNS